MRAIKFRAWDKEREEMIYQDKHTCFQIADEFIGIDCDETEDYDYREWSWNGSLNCELMQFTGLKDKNGTEIYEGDIVKFKITDCIKDKNNYIVAEVVWFKFGWILQKDNEMFNIMEEKFEVIGNICENPKLLNEVLCEDNSQQEPVLHSHTEKVKGRRVSEKVVASHIGESILPDADDALSQQSEESK